jgi:hypothetical protein
MKKNHWTFNRKNGQNYAVINLKSPDGKRQPKWINLNLECKRNNEVGANRNDTKEMKELLGYMARHRQALMSVMTDE